MSLASPGQAPAPETRESSKARSGTPCSSRHLLHLDGRPIPRSTLRSRFRRASIDAGIDPEIEHPGLTRNAVIAYLLSKGESAYLVAKLVGHKDIRTTLRYA
ncbi:MAG: site-specific integrase [Holophagales bacterium]|nr:MAG: site-specific integrase [Holophagales bacterium]